MRKIIKIMGWSGLLMMAAACEENGAETRAGESEGPVAVTFYIGTPESEEVEYTRTVQDAAETRIGSLTVYDFLVKQRTDGAKADTIFESVQHLADAGDGVDTPKAGQFLRTDAGATVCLSLHAPENTKHVFAFVANEEKTHFDSILYSKQLPIDSLRWTLSTRRLKDGEDCTALVGTQGAVMTGKSVTLDMPADLTDAEKMKVKLNRIMARIDVRNDVADAQNLKIVDVSVKNCAPAGYLFERGSDNAPTAATRPRGYKAISLRRNSGVTTEDLAGLKQGQTCGKVLYLYEYPATEKPVPTLVLTYTLNGSPKTMDVKMELKNTQIDIKRNRLYTLVVGGTSTRVTCEIN